MNNKKTFAKAWKLARKGAKKFGGTAKSYFSESLRIIYAANAIDSTINQSRFEALAGQPELTREDAIELASYQAAESKASFMRTMSAEYNERHNDLMALITELNAVSARAIISNSYTRGIVILKH